MSVSQRADRLLCCAIAYNASDVEANKIPSKFKSVDDAIASFMNCIWSEAKNSFQNAISQPQDAYLHPVDIGTDEPGIVTSKASKKNEIHRRKAPFPKVLYEKRPNPTAGSFKVPPTVSLEEARARAIQMMSASVENSSKQAAKDIKAEKRSAEASERREKKKQQRDAETKEEREERLAEQRLKREERKKTKELKELARESLDSNTENASSTNDAHEEGVSNTDSERAGDASSPPSSERADANITTSTVIVDIGEFLENEADADV